MLTILVHRAEGGLAELATVEQTQAALAEDGATVWVDFTGRSELATEIMREVFGLHSLAIEDVYKDAHRPKIEDYQRYVYMILQALDGDATSWDLAAIECTELDLFLGSNFIITHHSGELSAVTKAREAIRETPELMGKGAVYVAHAVLDRVVDRWLPLAHAYEAEIEKLEHSVLSEQGTNVLPRILALTGGLQQVRRAGLQQREILGRLARGEYDEVPQAAKPFFRDVHEHFASFLETIDFEREDLNSVFEAFHSLSSYRLNEVMKVLTIISTIVLPLTFLTGLYGMNFDNMPELHWWVGYYGLLGVMSLMVAVQVYYFRKRKWL